MTGEIAQMVLDGILDDETGEFIGHSVTKRKFYKSINEIKSNYHQLYRELREELVRIGEPKIFSKVIHSAMYDSIFGCDNREYTDPAKSKQYQYLAYLLS